MTKKKKKKEITDKEKIYKIIEQINANVDLLCAKQFYNYWYGGR